MKVLVVDDIPQNVYLLETLLKSYGHTTIAAVNGREALEKAGREMPDLIVTDVLMPEMDGFTLCRTLRSDARLSGIPLVIYTATYTDAKDAELGLAAGADRYIIKPADPVPLIEELQAVVAAPRKVAQPVPDEDPVYLKGYNARLVAKLEKKLVDLQAAQEAQKRVTEERERLTSLLRQSQKMEAVGRLAAGVAHDFNNILGGILGFAELARIEEAVPPSVVAHLDGIISAAQRAKDLVQHLLTFSRQKDRKRQALHVQAALSDVLKLLRASLPASVELRTTFDPSAPPIFANPTELHQIITNLVTNAWHAIGSGTGVIEIITDVVTPPGACRHVRLRVRDNGCGMDERIREHIFEPFFSTKAPGKGSGLGLAVVHGIVESCGGSITVQSEPGKGTTFTLIFPEHVGEVEAPAASRSTSPQGRGQKILFIDDDPTLATLGERFLKLLGYSVSAFCNPVEAIARLRQEPFALIITDLTMPYRNGLEVAHECMEIRPEVPVLIATGYNPSFNTDDLRQQGISAIILKPYTVQSLAEAVAKALSPKPA